MTTTDTVTLTLNRNDVGQVLDALDVRLNAWSRTADYLESDGAGDACDYGEIEECSSAEEAARLRDRYAEIINSIRTQTEQ